MTTTDSNGIVRYQTTDPVSPLHTLLNLGMQSVSDALTATNTALSTNTARMFKTVTLTTRPAHLAGLRIFETDTKNSYVSDGSSWIPLLSGDTGWISPALSGGWVNYGAPFVNARYMKRGGIVYVQGTIKNGVGGVFTLPAGFRPSGSIIFVGTSYAGLADVRVQSNGAVEISSLLNGGNNQTVTMNGISFPAEA